MLDTVPCAVSVPPPIRLRAGGPPIREHEATTNQRAVPEGDAGGGTNNTGSLKRVGRRRSERGGVERSLLLR
ncbi:hypothetical protein O3P69_008103 [Scylla paramamosain]|uniref:Uncharacterized protein n=1 Tax=Scylla paramamosain TaxID=85552 RepID=A0AAW0T256_SCYPA